MPCSPGMRAERFWGWQWHLTLIDGDESCYPFWSLFLPLLLVSSVSVTFRRSALDFSVNYFSCINDHLIAPTFLSAKSRSHSSVARLLDRFAPRAMHA